MAEAGTNNKITVEVNKQNLRDIELMFKQLPKQVDQSKVWVKFWRHVSKPLVKAAKSNAQALGGTGQLANSVGFFTTKASRKYNGGYVGPRVKGAFAKKDKETGKYSKSGYYGAFVEYGGEVNFGGKGTGKNQPWMANAFNTEKGTVLSNGMKDAEKIFERALKTHTRRLKKYGKLGY
mgnify:CR=1 FL=1|tara:strand:- start:7146 stop:7679 length:534 start_codon:yes stop_codon:yes gene_type:complete